MRVLIFHGYLLRGTGSNVYNASLATALARLGHEVHLLCQDREPHDLGAGAGGSVTIHNPDIGGLLPVFVNDTYDGFEVKTFAELSETELDRYIDANVTAVRDLAGELGGVDAALANHLVMGPVILARAGLDYALKVHGSDLSYTVLPELGRWRPFAEEAVAGAAGVLVGSGHIAARLRQAVGDLADPKLRLGPPGVDIDLFPPIPLPERPARLRELATALVRGKEEEESTDEAPRAGGGGGGTQPSTRRERRLGGPSPDRTREPSAWDRDAHQAAEAINWFAETNGPRVIFVGKLIVSKGVDLLLAAWPLVHHTNPQARLLVVGFGSGEAALRAVVEGFAAGDLGPLRELAERGRGLEGGEAAALSLLSAFLELAPEDYVEHARGAAGSIRFAGRLEHDEVTVPVSAADALVFPSTFPEAFGMVAAEAAAAGTLPVSARHSGAAEVSLALANDLPEEARDLLSFDLDEGAVAAIADRIDRWLAAPDAERERISEALRATTDRLWSWDGVARTVLAAAAGELDPLPRAIVD